MTVGEYSIPHPARLTQDKRAAWRHLDGFDDPRACFDPAQPTCRPPYRNQAAVADWTPGRAARRVSSASPSAPYDLLSQVYDEVIGRHSMLRAQRVLKWAFRRFGLCPGPAADLGCGTGLFVRHLCHLGCRPVYGVDRSATMLALAKGRNRHSAARFICQDIRRLRLPTAVDLITAHADVVNHLLSTSDLLRTFENVRSSVRPGGHFIFDVVTHDRPLPTRWTYTCGLPSRGVKLVENAEWDPRSGLMCIACFAHRPGRSGVRMEKQYERTYGLSDILRCLKQTGFQPMEVLPASAFSRAFEPWSREVVFARAV
jgi:SAM-dependent methyltransferase